MRRKRRASDGAVTSDKFVGLESLNLVKWHSPVHVFMHAFGSLAWCQLPPRNLFQALAQRVPHLLDRAVFEAVYAIYCNGAWDVYFALCHARECLRYLFQEQQQQELTDRYNSLAAVYAAYYACGVSYIPRKVDLMPVQLSLFPVKPYQWLHYDQRVSIDVVYGSVLRWCLDHGDFDTARRFAFTCRDTTALLREMVAPYGCNDCGVPIRRMRHWRYCLGDASPMILQEMYTNLGIAEWVWRDAHDVDVHQNYHVGTQLTTWNRHDNDDAVVRYHPHNGYFVATNNHLRAMVNLSYRASASNPRDLIFCDVEDD